MTTTDTTDHTDELNTVDRERLTEAAGRLDDWGSALNPPSALRYAFYRRRGYDKDDALSFALAWLRNSNEQFERRLSHDTGAEGWRAIN